MLTDDFDLIEKVLAEAKQEATKSPGIYGGRYVGRRSYKTGQTWHTQYVILANDDPASKETKEFDKIGGDVFAQVTPTKVWGIGHARYWLNADGTIDRKYFDCK